MTGLPKFTSGLRLNGGVKKFYSDDPKKSLLVIFAVLYIGGAFVGTFLYNRIIFPWDIPRERQIIENADIQVGTEAENNEMRQKLERKIASIKKNNRQQYLLLVRNVDSINIRLDAYYKSKNQSSAYSGYRGMGLNENFYAMDHELGHVVIFNMSTLETIYLYAVRSNPLVHRCQGERYNYNKQNKGAYWHAMYPINETATLVAAKAAINCNMKIVLKEPLDNDPIKHQITLKKFLAEYLAPYQIGVMREIALLLNGRYFFQASGSETFLMAIWFTVREIISGSVALIPMHWSNAYENIKNDISTALYIAVFIFVVWRWNHIYEFFSRKKFLFHMRKNNNDIINSIIKEVEEKERNKRTNGH